MSVGGGNRHIEWVRRANVSVDKIAFGKHVCTRNRDQRFQVTSLQQPRGFPVEVEAVRRLVKPEPHRIGQVDALVCNAPQSILLVYY